MSNLNWCFDAAAGVMLILFLIYGIRKGASRTFVPFLVNIVFVVLAFFMSGVIAGTMYETMVSDSVEMAVEEVKTEAIKEIEIELKKGIKKWKL